MKIGLKNKNLIIEYEHDEFNSLQFQQLKFWDYKIVKKENILWRKGASDKILKQIIYFLDQNSIEYSMSTEIKERVKSIVENRENLARALETGEQIKNGSFENINFDSFDSFLDTLPRKLKDHQKKAAIHLYTVNNGANFSVPGSGKTTVVLSVFEKLRRERKVDRIFVVGPTASFEPWKDEFYYVLGRRPKFKILAGGDKSYRTNEYYNTNSDIELLLTSFQTLLNDYNHVKKYFKHENISPYVVIDEAHYIKQLDGSWANAVLELAEHSKYRSILTGTPIPKSYSDLYNQFEFLWPNNEIFSKREKARISISEKQNDIETASQLVEEKIGPLFYRVRKKDLGLSEQHFHNPIMLKMNKHEQNLYDAIEQRIAAISKEVYLENIDLINRLRRGRIMRLRQCVSYPKLLNSAIEEYKEELITNKDLKKLIINYDNIEKPRKLEYLTNYIVNDLGKDKLVVWAHFVDAIKLIENHLKHNGINCKSIFGDTPFARNDQDQGVETREKIISLFKDPSSGLQVLIANPAACSESISLHKVCNKAIYYDLSYNSAQFLQSLDRIHRVGGSEDIPAHYYFLQYENSFESDILQNLYNKTTKMEAVVEKEYDIYSIDLVLGDEELEAYERLFSDE